MRYLTLLIITLAASIASAQPVRVGAKHFNEGYILSEIISQLLESRGFEVERQYHLGGTLVCFEALNRSEIDVYPEYTGTISAEILKLQAQASDEEINELLLDRHQLTITSHFGFSNAYALVLPKHLADSLQLYNLSDLQQYPQLKAGISYEFLKRADGWEKLSAHYQLGHVAAGMEHGLAYQAMKEGSIDLTDAYTTDGEIAEANLMVLKDDRHFFPEYQAVVLHRVALTTDAVDALHELNGRITEVEMQLMNAQALGGRSYESIAAEFLSTEGLTTAPKEETGDVSDMVEKTFRHLWLVLVALALAIALALPLGVALHWNKRISNAVIYLAGLLQTVPSIALLAIMIPLFGIGVTPAIAALFLYAILPILRNTVAGLQGIDPLLVRMAEGIGMTRRQQLWLVEIPLATPVIIAGIRTAAVISVGTATLAAFIGAGGLGEYIVTGLALNNTGLILRGAIPAAILALLVELGFELLERRLRKRTRA